MNFTLCQIISEKKKHSLWLDDLHNVLIYFIHCHPSHTHTRTHPSHPPPPSHAHTHHTHPHTHTRKGSYDNVHLTKGVHSSHLTSHVYYLALSLSPVLPSVVWPWIFYSKLYSTELKLSAVLLNLKHLHEGESTVADEEEVLPFLKQSLEKHLGLFHLLQVNVCQQSVSP